MNSTELRQEDRLDTPMTVFIELIAADNHIPSTIVISHSLDISTNGLRVITDRELPVGSILHSCIQCNDSMQRFVLSTEVKWCRSYLHLGEYLIGLSLFESEDTDIQQWKTFISEQYIPSEK